MGRSHQQFLYDLIARPLVVRRLHRRDLVERDLRARAGVRHPVDGPADPRASTSRSAARSCAARTSSTRCCDRSLFALLAFGCGLRRDAGRRPDRDPRDHRRRCRRRGRAAAAAADSRVPARLRADLRVRQADAQAQEACGDGCRSRSPRSSKRCCWPRPRVRRTSSTPRSRRSRPRRGAGVATRGSAGRE